MKKSYTFLITMLATLPIHASLKAASKQERPNILWLTFEDTSPYEFGCYGNKQNHTPTIDSLAKVGYQYINAYSNGPQSSPSRSTLITGAYAPTFGMEQHRQRVTTPDYILMPNYLREAGYYCTNNQKTDYNTTLDNTECWDNCTNRATYNDPARGDKPFFAVFNSMVTHMGRLISFHTEGRRDFSLEGLDPNTLELPAHVADIPEIRSDYAFHLEGSSDIDRWVNIFLDDLKKQGLDDNTIVFIFSDHGGCLPRGKGFCYETSYRVPMIVYLPAKWQHLAKQKKGQNERMVSFVDLAPTVLSLANVEPPKYMQGLPFLGRYDTTERKYQIGYTGNQASHYLPMRTIQDGRYHYIRRYIPYRNDALLNSYQWMMPSNLHWDKRYFDGTLSNPIWSYPFVVDAGELLFDTEKDPFEINNLANDPKFEKKKLELRAALDKHVRQSGDLGFFIRESRITKEGNFYDNIHSNGYDLETLYKLAELPLTVSPKDIKYLQELYKSASIDQKYWIAVNYAVLARKGKLDSAPNLLIQMMDKSPAPRVSVEAAYALCFTQERERAMESIYNYLIKDKTQSLAITALEVLSFDKQVSALLPEKIREYVRLKGSEVSNKRSNADSDTGDVNSSFRKLLVNWGELPAEKLYGDGDEIYQIGLTVNKHRRPLVPTPTYYAPNEQRPNQSQLPNNRNQRK